MAKNISVVVAGSGEIRDLTVSPGTKVKEVLDAAGLNGYLLSKGPNDPFLSQNDDLHQAVSEGTKLYASTPAEAGQIEPARA